MPPKPAAAAVIDLATWKTAASSAGDRCPRRASTAETASGRCGSGALNAAEREAAAAAAEDERRDGFCTVMGEDEADEAPDERDDEVWRLSLEDERDELSDEGERDDSNAASSAEEPAAPLVLLLPLPLLLLLLDLPEPGSD